MLIPRENYLARIRPFYDVDLVKVLIGSRRSGKSAILELIINELKEKGVQSEDILYINFENLAYEDIRDYKTLNAYVMERKGKRKQYLFFDEIQNVEGFEKAIDSFRVSFDCSIFITGSNSKMLSSEISTLLTGRIIEFPIYPFTYSESQTYRHELGREIERPFQDFLRLGGYPLRFQLPDEAAVKAYLQELYDNILVKDILGRDKNINKERFTRIAKYVLANAGSDFNPQSIANYMKSADGGRVDITLPTIYDYLDKLEKAFLIRPIYRYDLAGKKALKSNPKYYAIDNGMRLIESGSTSFDLGRALENLVCIELLSRGYEVYVGKTYKGEVDFVAMKNGKKCFLQIAYLMSDERTLEREFSAFSPIKDPSPKYVLSLDEIDLSQNGITHYNLVDFLSGKVDLFLS